LEEKNRSVNDANRKREGRRWKVEGFAVWTSPRFVGALK
jgi:hypothetical protein